MNSADIKFWRYYIPSIDGLEGWGVFLLDSTGMFAAVTDYGNYAYMWPIEHTGVEDFRDFFKHRDAYYVLGKCAPSRKREYQGEETRKLIRERIIEARREGYISEEEARKEWDLTEDHDLDYAEGFGAWYENTNLCDAHEYAVYGYTSEEKAFADKLFPRFCDAVAKELATERELITVVEA
ncbi:hypothetical protein ACYCSU_23940 [Paenibacillus sp. ALE1]|uniref:hypothetical protein n=1 Tax=Paenibacillus polymyxa TaxID=1406 RepID=UPI0023786AF5|nr:hypothetical protein [Paenibacillus polymyxa]WDM22617.1 hypothetical protein J4I02_03065 [Paenibacillus polymyxa]